MEGKRGVECVCVCVYALGQEALLGIYRDEFLFGKFPVSAKGGGGLVPAIFVT